MTNRKQEMRKATEAKYVAKQREAIDAHDLLHSIFWNKPSREEMHKVYEALNRQIDATKIDLMQGEIEELVDLGMSRLGK